MIDLNNNKIGKWTIDAVLLEEALTHPNLHAFSPEKENFERLEYLGDAILDLFTAEWLYQNIIEEVGILSKIRSLLVQTESLAEIGKDINLHKRIITIPRYKITKTDIEDCLEAIFGALYTAKGLEIAREFFKDLFLDKLEKYQRDLSNDKKRKKLLKLTVCEENPINTLQEFCQKRGYKLPVYRLLEKKGKEHEPVYIMECSIKHGDIEYKGKGKGRNKKQARMEAAEEIVKHLKIKKK